MTKTSPLDLIRVRKAAGGALCELYFESGGVLPLPLHGMYTSPTEAMALAKRFYESKEGSREPQIPPREETKESAPFLSFSGKVTS